MCQLYRVYRVYCQMVKFLVKMEKDFQFSGWRYTSVAASIAASQVPDLFRTTPLNPKPCIPKSKSKPCTLKYYKRPHKGKAYGGPGWAPG